MVIVKPFHLFELGGGDIILGVEWMEKLGEVLIDWSQLTMVLHQEGKKVKVRGDPTLERKVVEPRALLKMGDAEAWMLFGSWARLK